jgi:hypothetical protein
MNPETFRRMVDISMEVMERLGCRRAASGGAAWADHAAVRLALTGFIRPADLDLHLPCPFEGGRYRERDHAGSISNHYHRLFREDGGVDGLGEIARAIDRGAAFGASPGFRARDRRIARGTGAVLAFTFGNPKSPGAYEPWVPYTYGDEPAGACNVKEGGTHRTWDASRSGIKIHVMLA